jgi:FdhE protein
MASVIQGSLLVRNWTARTERARYLADQHTAAESILQFYSEVLAFQSRTASRIRQTVDPAIPLRDQIDLAQAVACFPDLLGIVVSQAAAPLATAAKELEMVGESGWRELLASPFDDASLDWFFALAILQPFAENLQFQLPESNDQGATRCSACGGLPQLAILRPEGEGARRSLQCSFCLREWAFRRVLCPSCGETDKEKLPYYSVEECRHVRIEACDTCHRYVKAVDLGVDGLAVPLVDDVALAALDIWAGNHGYEKIAKNLTGL